MPKVSIKVLEGWTILDNRSTSKIFGIFLLTYLRFSEIVSFTIYYMNIAIIIKNIYIYIYFRYNEITSTRFFNENTAALPTHILELSTLGALKVA